MIVDKSGAIFENRRKEDRRKVNVKVDVDRRKGDRRTTTSSKKSK